VHELIWFSIPGGVLALAAALVWPCEFKETDPALVLAAALGAGFGVQQVTRTVFERFGGYRRRLVIEEIQRVYSIGKRNRYNLMRRVFEVLRRLRGRIPLGLGG
jgi:hypothetical protein